MKLLVTGSAGFIASAFVRQCLGKGRLAHFANAYPGMGLGIERIVSLDLLTYAGCRDNLALVDADPRHVFVKGDICDRALVASLVKEYGITHLLNFAAESHVDRSIEGSEPFARTNVIGTVALLDAAKNFGLKYLQVSTDEVYGSLGDTGAFSEETPLAPNSPYSASKAAADCFVRAYVETHKICAVTTRCSNNYGPYQFPEKFLPVAITALMDGKQIPVYGEGKNTRDWLHVEDHNWAVWLALTKGKSGEIYNIGGYGETRNIDLAHQVLKSFGISPEKGLRYVEDRKGHDWRYAMDPTKISNELGWKPAWTLEKGLADTVTWYKENEAWWRPKAEK
ncbi:MAG: dTDP-glucose 4,6-dehydratase [Bdellovibrionota bacterium]